MTHIAKEKGFTLVELMITTAIVIILLSVGIPETRKWTNAHKGKKSAVELFTDMRKARVMAIVENNNYVVSFDKNNNSYRIFDDNNNSESFDVGDVDMFAGGWKTLDSLELTSVQITGNTFVFKPSGNLKNGVGGNVAVKTLQGSTYTISVSGTTGRVSMTKSS